MDAQTWVRFRIAESIADALDPAESVEQMERRAIAIAEAKGYVFSETVGALAVGIVINRRREKGKGVRMAPGTVFDITQNVGTG